MIQIERIFTGIRPKYRAQKINLQPKGTEMIADNEKRTNFYRLRPVCRLLVIEDDDQRVALFRSWLPDHVKLVVARSAGSAIGILQRDKGRVYAGILLDHDLQMQRLTELDRYISGMNAVETIINNISKEVPLLVHSMNQTRAPLMLERLKGAGFDVTQMPMAQLTRQFFLDWFEDVIELWEDHIEDLF